MEGNIGYKYSVYDCLNFLINEGAPSGKLLMGIPTYGRTFTVSDQNENGVYCPVNGSMPAGPYTRQDGILGYMEILELMKYKNLTNYPDLVGVQEDFTVMLWLKRYLKNTM